MKRINSSILLFLLIIFNSIIVFASDSNKNITPILENKNIKETTEYVQVNLNIPVLTIIDDKKISTKINDEIYNDVLIWRNELTEEAKSYNSDYKNSNIEFSPFILDTKYKVTYNKNNILSITMLYYQYSGGAHGLTTEKSYNFNLKTGEIIKLENLFKSSFDYNTKINQYIRNEIAKKPEEYFDNGAIFKGIKTKQDFYISNDGVVIYFQLYEISPYAGGIREFKIPFSFLESGLKYKL